MDHSTILTLNWRNMFTIIVMVTIGWFFIHLFGNLFGGSFSTNASVNVGNGGGVSVGGGYDYQGVVDA